jgi:tetratricopeptide (TPR) repeat protein
MNINKKLQTALHHHQTGNLQLAGHLYSEILRSQPDYIPVLHLLGVLFYQLGDYDAAIVHIKKALSLNPNNPEAYNHLGSALKAKGKIDEAIVCHQQAVKLNPYFAEAYYNLGNACIDKSQKDEAIGHYRKAIELHPNFFQAYFNLGKTFQDRGKPDEAIFYYQKASELNPDSADTYDALGILFQGKGQLEEAIEYYHKAIGLNPNFAGCYGNLGKAFQENGSLDKALISYNKALELNADQAVLGILYNNIGVVYQEKGQFDEAISCYQKALQIDPTLAGIYKNLGTVFHDIGLFDEATTYYQKALAINPDDAEIYCNLGSVSEDNGQLDKALTLYQKALQINPSFADAHWNISIAQLKSGNFKEGWKKYEWRFLRKGDRPSAFPHPRWDGSSLKGKVLLVCAEQGVGDEIMFASCLPEVIAEADSCIVECDRRLIPLFARSFPKAQFIERINNDTPHPAQLPAADMKIAIGSLPLFLRPDPSHFSQPQSYLVPNNQKLEIWRKRFAVLGTGLKIGISWRGGSKPAVKLARTIDLDQWTPLFSVPGVHFINLQYGDCSVELREAEEKIGVTIHHWGDSDPLKDLDGFAAQVSALDLVISVDNSTVHIAGALGIPVWALLPFACDWRWMREYEDTPWYKTVELFRQNSQGDWNSVFERLTSNLKQYISTSVMPGKDPVNSFKSVLKV